jgi:hypothetical protein
MPFLESSQGMSSKPTTPFGGTKRDSATRGDSTHVTNKFDESTSRISTFHNFTGQNFSKAITSTDLPSPTNAPHFKEFLNRTL